MSGAYRYRPAQRLNAGAVGALLQSGRVGRAPGMLIRYAGNGCGFARLALAVPKRALARAVDRNRVRRALREWFRRHQSAIGARDLLIRIDSGAIPARTLIADLNRVLRLDR